MKLRHNRIITDALREIRNTFSRFLSLLVLSALAVCFLAGLRATAPDMKKSADLYFDQQNLMDLHVLSTLGLTDKDAEAFEPLSKAYGLPKEERGEILEQALYGASVVPLEIMETVLEAMDFLSVVEEKGSRLAVSDAGVGALFAGAALEGASLNVFINTKLMADREKAEMLNEKADRLIKEGRKKKEEIYGNALKKIR